MADTEGAHSQDLVKLVSAAMVSSTELDAARERHYGGLAEALAPTDEAVKLDEETQFALFAVASSLAEREVEPLEDIDDATYLKRLMLVLTAQQTPRNVIDAVVAHTGAKKLTAKDLAAAQEAMGKVSQQEAVILAIFDEMLEALQAAGIALDQLRNINVVMFMNAAAEVYYELNFGEKAHAEGAELVVQAVVSLGEQMGIDSDILNAVVDKMSD